MFLFPCFTCGLAVRVIDTSEASDILRSKNSVFADDGYHCVRCDASITPYFENEVDPLLLNGLHIRDLTPTEAFVAFSGAGLPEEHGCDAKSVEEHLLTGVESVEVVDVPNTLRSCVLSIKCKNGTRIFFGSSTYGAVVYRLQAKFSYREQLEKGESK